MNNDNLKTYFRELRDYFAGNVTGITRDEKIAEVIIRILFCKIWDESQKSSKKRFHTDENENLELFKERFEGLFKDVKANFPHLFDDQDQLDLDASALYFVVSKLQHVKLLELKRDVIGDAFEEFIGTAFRGGEGQFFTPRNVVEMMVKVLNPSNGERIIDPACGSGGFLAYAIRHLELTNAKSAEVVGIDKDEFLAKVARTYTSLLLNKESKVFCENSLANPALWSEPASSQAELGSFDLIITNPPFGAKIPVVGKELLAQYKLSEKPERAGKKQILTKQAPQILFIERCVQLLKPGGRMGIVLPEGVFGNASDKYVWDYLKSEGTIFGVVSLSQETFQPSTHTKTSVLFFRKSFEPSDVFMGIATRIGHNKNGKETYKLDAAGQPILNGSGQKIPDDEIPAITDRFIGFLEGKETAPSHLGFILDSSQISNHVYIPEFYDPELTFEIEQLRNDNRFAPQTIGELVKNGALKITRGKEIGSHFYGTGDIPFIRTSDLVNWELKIDPIKSVSQDAYDLFSRSQDVRPNDILFVNDGTFLIGRTAMISEGEERILIQSHLKKFRVMPKCKFDAFYLMFLLNTEIVQKQIRARTFVQATISTIGDRLMDVVLPISIDESYVSEKSTVVKRIIDQKRSTRELMKQVLASKH